MDQKPWIHHSDKNCRVAYHNLLSQVRFQLAITIAITEGTSIHDAMAYVNTRNAQMKFDVMRNIYYPFRLVIMSPDEKTKYLDFDLKVGGKCTTDMCSKTTARVGLQGFNGLSAKIYDLLIVDR